MKSKLAVESTEEEPRKKNKKRTGQAVEAVGSNVAEEVEHPEITPAPKKRKKTVELVDAADDDAPETTTTHVSTKKGRKKAKLQVADADKEDVIAEVKHDTATAGTRKDKLKKVKVPESSLAAEAEQDATSVPKKSKKGAAKVRETGDEEAEVQQDNIPVPGNKKNKQKGLTGEEVKKQEPQDGCDAQPEAEQTFRAFVGGLPWAVDDSVLRKDFEECGEVADAKVMIHRDTGLSKGFGFVTFETLAGLEAALKYDGQDYGGRTLKVTRDSKKPEKPEESVNLATRLEVFLKGLAPAVTEETLRKDFQECGKITKLNMPTLESGKCKGFAWITFKTAEARDKAIQRSGTMYIGRKLTVEKAGQHRKDAESQGTGGKKGGGKGSKELEVFVKNFPYETTETGLRKAFADCGEITRLHMPTVDTGKCMGFAWITFANKEGMQRALDRSDEDLDGRRIFIEKSGLHKS